MTIESIIEFELREPGPPGRIQCRQQSKLSEGALAESGGHQSKLNSCT